MCVFRCGFGGHRLAQGAPQSHIRRPSIVTPAGRTGRTRAVEEKQMARGQERRDHLWLPFFLLTAAQSPSGGSLPSPPPASFVGPEPHCLLMAEVEGSREAPQTPGFSGSEILSCGRDLWANE